MTDLISTPPAPASPALSKVETGDFWPDIDVNAVRDVLALGGTTIPHERLVAAIRFGVLEVTTELAAWQALKIADARETLADVDPDNVIDAIPVAVHQFNRAVAMMAAAELADRYKDLTITPKGMDRADERTDMADDFRRSATRAIRAITGATGTLVDLV